MDIRQLKHLVALVELGTVNAAAEDQFISQPGLSGSIKRLEAHLGVVLFKRDGRGMEANARCKDFYRHAKQILEQLRLAEVELEGGPSNLFIGLGEVRPVRFATILYEKLMQLYPNLSLTFVEEHFETLFVQIENGDVDVAFVAAPPDFIPSTLTGKLLAESESLVYCAANHPLTQHRGPIPAAALKEFPWVKNAATPPGAPFLPRFTGYKKDPLGDVSFVTAASQQLAKDLVAQSNVLGFGPRVCWDRELAHNEVVELDLSIKKLYIPIMEIRRRDAHSTVLDNAFAIAEDYYRNHGPT
jgi:DNA-binding transcriptional LysR family regulator